MNAIDLARTAYAPSNTSVRTAQRTEYEAFARITRQLKNSSGKNGSFKDMVMALHENRRLWSILALDLVDAANGLPEELRARLLYLAEFTEHATSQVLVRKMKPSVLIEINLAIMGGLRSQEGQK